MDDSGLTKRFVLKYSTVDEYFKAMQTEATQKQIKWPIYRGEFMSNENIAPL